MRVLGDGRGIGRWERHGEMKGVFRDRRALVDVGGIARCGEIYEV